jgi:hypothetical protein
MKNIFIFIVINITILSACGPQANEPQNNHKPNDINQAKSSSIYNNTEPKSAFAKKFKERYKGFTMINPDFLNTVVQRIPAQKSPWSCGLHQSEAVIEVAYSNNAMQRQTQPDFQNVGDYPLALDINLNNNIIKSLVESIIPANLISALEKAADDKGNFRVGALPHDLAAYINKKLPHNYELKAQAQSSETITVDEFFRAVKNNLSQGLPTLALAQSGELSAHVYLIVGFKNTEVLILNTSDEGMERFFSQEAKDFIAEMNMSKLISIIKLIELIPDIRTKIQEGQGNIADVAVIRKWQPYSVIEFVRKN